MISDPVIKKRKEKRNKKKRHLKYIENHSSFYTIKSFYASHKARLIPQVMALPLSYKGGEASRPAQVVSYREKRNLSNVGRSGHVTTAAGPVDVDVLVLREVLVGVLGLDAEGVGTEVVTLGLQQVGREVLGTVTVVEAESSAEGRQRDTQNSSLADDVSPALLSVVDSVGEELVEQKVVEVRVVTVGVSDVLEENGTDNATTTPHESDGWVVQLPAILLSSLPDEHKALGVGDDLRGIEGLLKVIDESLLVTGEFGSGTAQDVASLDTLVLLGTQATREDGLANESDGHTKVKGVDGGPLASTLLTGLVEDLVDEGCAVVVVVVQNVTSDFDQEGVKDTLVPLGEDIANLLAGESKTALHEVIGLVLRKKWLAECIICIPR